MTSNLMFPFHLLTFVLVLRSGARVSYTSGAASELLSGPFISGARCRGWADAVASYGS